MKNLTSLSEMLTGRSREHLIPLPNPISDKHALQAPVVNAFLALQHAAKQAGFNLQPASTFRDFDRQALIWNAKFYGQRKVHDDHGNPIAMEALSEWEKLQAILRWSAIAGASRHHWGTEIDIFDPDLLPEGQPLLLEPWEYQTGGYFQQLTNWLLVNAELFGFYFPFLERDDKNIGLEPWHISYFPLADQYERLFSAEMLQQAWEGQEIAGKACAIEHLDEIFARFIL